ncbi:signal peptidase I [Patescibacteria group bacterium]|nr:signal peptidase I [Patescibacteria group bacterium]
MKKKKVLKVVLNVGLIVALLVSITPSILVLYSFLFSLAGADRIFMPVIGYSMAPALMNGDTILIKKGTEGIQVGDIISFKVDSIPVTIVHRVVDIGENPILTFRTKGDANERPDKGKITADQVVGKVVHIVPTRLLMTSYILFASILMPAILILVRIFYCFSKKNTATKRFEYPILNSTTIILMTILALSGSRLLILLILAPMF